MSLNTKTVKRWRYDYFQYMEDGKVVQKYCGPSGSVRAQKEYLRLEKVYLRHRMDAIKDKLEKNGKRQRSLNKQGR